LYLGIPHKDLKTEQVYIAEKLFSVLLCCHGNAFVAAETSVYLAVAYQE
jgi:hypothetical protein